MDFNTTASNGPWPQRCILIDKRVHASQEPPERLLTSYRVGEAKNAYFSLTERDDLGFSAAPCNIPPVALQQHYYVSELPRSDPRDALLASQKAEIHGLKSRIFQLEQERDALASKYSVLEAESNAQQRHYDAAEQFLRKQLLDSYMAVAERDLAMQDYKLRLAQLETAFYQVTLANSDLKRRIYLVYADLDHVRVEIIGKAQVSNAYPPVEIQSAIYPDIKDQKLPETEPYPNPEAAPAQQEQLEQNSAEALKQTSVPLEYTPAPLESVADNANNEYAHLLEQSATAEHDPEGLPEVMETQTRLDNGTQKQPYPLEPARLNEPKPVNAPQNRRKVVKKRFLKNNPKM